MVALGHDSGVNTVALLTTRLAPSMLLTYLQAIEARHGRERTVRVRVAKRSGKDI